MPEQHCRCPVCAGSAPLHDVVDFNRNCEEARGLVLPLSGEAVYYARCTGCGFTFAPQFSHWTPGQFVERIYNQDYARVDPDYLEARPQGNAALLDQLFGEQRSAIRHLDYGGGNGHLSSLLQAAGWQTATYDPFPAAATDLAALGRFNLITAFEVFEHVPDVHTLMTTLRHLMADPCLVLFSTLLSDGHLLDGQRLTWWYAAPRNGHISLFSRTSLVRLGEQHQLRFGSFGEGLHCFVNQVPAWAAHLFR